MRAYSSNLLRTIPFQKFSNDFVFDQQMMICAYAQGFMIGEIDIPVRYFSEASSIQFARGTKFLLETLSVLFRYLLAKLNIYHDPFYSKPS